MNELTIAAPAKLNLFLHITGRRADGYHELETLFQFLSVCDDLHFTLTSDGDISLKTNLQGVDAEDNLIIRAARALQPYRHDGSYGALIHLQKQIPMGGGLGGGSSDAASTLLALNKLWRLDLPIDTLATIGLQLGADVPVFVHGQATLARGVGEKFSPAEPALSWYLVINPGVHVSTAEVFTHPDLPRNTPALREPLCNWQTYHNDCQALVASLYPPVANALEWLVEYAPTRMTGTGACVFACFDSEADALQVLAKLPEEFSGFVAQGLNTSPAWQAL
jgi:4-diphosphocytidyl-2-C-methyl-D-erythritol kinase